jgi:hypothetical protein
MSLPNPISSRSGALNEPGRRLRSRVMTTLVAQIGPEGGYLHPVNNRLAAVLGNALSHEAPPRDVVPQRRMRDPGQGLGTPIARSGEHRLDRRVESRLLRARFSSHLTPPSPEMSRSSLEPKGPSLSLGWHQTATRAKRHIPGGPGGDTSLVEPDSPTVNIRPWVRQWGGSSLGSLWMSVRVGRFPPSVAKALQDAEGSVEFRYTRPHRPWPRRDRIVLMETQPEPVLASLTLERREILVFTRTGSPREGARTAQVAVSHLLDSVVWTALAWNPYAMSVGAR